MLILIDQSLASVLIIGVYLPQITRT